MSNKVLLVDDEGTVLKCLSRALSTDYDLTTAYSSPEALTLMQNTKFGVIVTDMRMPGGDGSWLINLASQVSPSTEFIVLTGNCDEESRDAVMQNEKVSSFLNKPCSIDTIGAAIDEAMVRHKEYLCPVV